MKWIREPIPGCAGYTEAMLALTPTEAAILADALRKPLREMQKQLVRLGDIHDSGEATERQEARRCDIGEAVTVLEHFFELESLDHEKEQQWKSVNGAIWF